MSARLLDGRALAARRQRALAARVATLPFRPSLVVLLVGDDPASAIYVRAKDRAAQETGLLARTIRLPGTTTTATLLAQIAELNRNPAVDGILLQLPVPSGIDAQAAIEAIDPTKDVDGFHPLNAGRLVDDRPGLRPCTPRAVMALLDEAGVTLSGARVTVLGRSGIVGRPVSLMLTHADATVTLLHSRSRDIATECRRCDVLVAAVGRPGLVVADWVSKGAVVVDVGINRLADGRLVGDVDPGAALVADAITPVPGGVGPMTIACLLENTVQAAMEARGLG